MTERDLSTYAEQDLADPAIEPATLGHLATARPDLRPAILGHPNCYPALAEWLRARIAPEEQRPQTGAPAGGQTAPQGSPAGAQQPQAGATSAPSARPASAPSPEAWAASFQQRVGREPSMSEYQAAVAAGEVAQTRATPSFAAGAQEAASAASAGAKEFFQNRVAPAAQNAARNFQETVNDKNATPLAKLIRIAGFVLPAVALLAIVGLFLPAISASGWGYEESVNMFQADGPGIFLLILDILAIAGAVVWIVLGTLWARMTAACVGALTGLVTLVVTILVFVGASDASGWGVSASAGFGTVILLLLSLLTIAASVLMFFPTEKKAPAGPYAAPTGAAGPSGAAGYPGAAQPGAPAGGYPGASQPGAPGQPGQQYPGASQPGGYPGASPAGGAGQTSPGASQSAAPDQPGQGYPGASQPGGTPEAPQSESGDQGGAAPYNPYGPPPAS